MLLISSLPRLQYVNLGTRVSNGLTEAKRMSANDHGSPQKRFLDDHPVLLHVPFEIVSEEIASVEAERRLPVWDPYLGNRIEGAWAKIHERSTKMGVLAFPMGAVGHELSEPLVE
jgi:hypothetical protein